MKILFVSRHFPPGGGGSSVIIANLIKGLKPDDVAGVAAPYERSANSEGVNVFPFFTKELSRLSSLAQLQEKLQYPKELKRLVVLIKQLKVTHVVGVYPDFIFLKLAFEAAQESGAHFIPYLHDTVVEGLSHTRYKSQAKTLHERMLETSSLVFVMSEGMQNLYRKKYQRETEVLQHSFPEGDLQSLAAAEKLENSVFWGGAIYRINKNATLRVFKAAGNLAMKVEVASKISLKKIKSLGLDANNTNVQTYDRATYLDKLRSQKVLILALDFPDESDVHQDELATIFPTKSIEYLAAGRPILVHCPEHYFMYRFFKKHDCAFLVAERSPEALELALQRINDQPEQAEMKVANAQKSLAYFMRSSVVDKFYKAIGARQESGVTS